MSLASRIVAGADVPEDDRVRWVAFGERHGIAALSDAIAILDTPEKRALSAELRAKRAQLAAFTAAMEAGDKVEAERILDEAH